MGARGEAFAAKPWIGPCQVGLAACVSLNRDSIYCGVDDDGECLRRMNPVTLNFGTEVSKYFRQIKIH